MIPYLCIRAILIICSSFKWIGNSRNRLYTPFSSFGFSFTLNFVLLPISILCLAKMSNKSTRITSIDCSSVSSRSVSAESNRSRNAFRDSVPSCGLSFSFF